jgi:hypothetical protein|eukprot:COSAG01_NODE_281_length_19504_cov_129.173124_30_plen_255_part_00
MAEAAQEAAAAAPSAAASEASGPEIELPPSFGVRGAICRAVPTVPKRSFGTFAEKTLECNLIARDAIDRVCHMGGFTQSWAAHAPGADTFTMTKIPVVILVKLMLGLPEEQEVAAQSLKGAYSICMDTTRRTCMNVIVGRRPNGAGGFVMDKFSLYWPDNAAVPAEWTGGTWELLQGYSFRTAVLNGSLNRADLHGLRSGSIPGVCSWPSPGPGHPPPLWSVGCTEVSLTCHVPLPAPYELTRSLCDSPRRRGV